MPTALALAKSSSSASASDLPKGSSNTSVQYSASFSSMTVTGSVFGLSGASGAGAVGDTGTDNGSIVAPDVVCRVGTKRCYGMAEIKNQIQSRVVNSSRRR